MIHCLVMQAETLLRKNLENANASLEVLVADLQFLRDQVTITQVHSTFAICCPGSFVCKEPIGDGLKICFTTIKSS